MDKVTKVTKPLKTIHQELEEGIFLVKRESNKAK